MTPKIALISKVTNYNIFIRILSFNCQSNKIKKLKQEREGERNDKGTKICDCLHVTLKSTPLLASQVALFYDTSLLIQHMLILSVLLLLDSFM